MLLRVQASNQPTRIVNKIKQKKLNLPYPNIEFSRPWVLRKFEQSGEPEAISQQNDTILAKIVLNYVNQVYTQQLYLSI